jgi:hypothetical protein
VYDAFFIQNVLKQSETLLPLPFKFDLEYVIREVQKNHQRLE